MGLRARHEDVFREGRDITYILLTAVVLYMGDINNIHKKY